MLAAFLFTGAEPEDWEIVFGVALMSRLLRTEILQLAS